MNNRFTTHRTISLIGMPGVGKSTVGVILAKLCGLGFCDTDLAIQQRQGASLQDILEEHGNQGFRRVEQEVLLDVDLEDAVVSTGGSVIFSRPVMDRLKAAGPLVYLRADIVTLEQRVAANPLRGIARDRSQTFADVYAERCPIYEHYADVAVDAADGSADQVAAAIHNALS